MRHFLFLYLSLLMMNKIINLLIPYLYVTTFILKLSFPSAHIILIFYLRERKSLRNLRQLWPYRELSKGGVYELIYFFFFRPCKVHNFAKFTDSTRAMSVFSSARLKNFESSQFLSNANVVSMDRDTRFDLAKSGIIG